MTTTIAEATRENLPSQRYPEFDYVIETRPVEVLPFKKIGILPQFRKGVNPERVELKESIDNQGLINAMGVYRMGLDDFIELTTIVQKAWGEEINLEDYLDYFDENGNILVLNNGESRYHAIEDIAIERGIDPDKMGVSCSVNEFASAQEFIARQLAENIHNQPPSERRAMAIVQAYVGERELPEYVEMTDQEFIHQFTQKHKDKFNRAALRDAIGFAQLPTVLRKNALDGTMRYSVASALGWSRDSIREYLRLDPSVQTTEELEEAVDLKMSWLSVQVPKSKSVKKSLGIIEAFLNDIKGSVLERRELADQFTLDVMPEETGQSQLEKLHEELRTELTSLAASPLDTVATILENFRMYGQEVRHETLAATRRRIREALGKTGQFAAINAELLVISDESAA